MNEFFNPTSFIGQAVWALLALSLLTAPIGCFVVWRKLSYFGATLAHSALLGAIIGLLTGVGIITGVLGFTVVLALILSVWLQNRHVASDTMLGMIAHVTLAIGIIAVSVMDNLRMDVMAYLFGDVFALSTSLFYTTVILSLLGCGLVVRYWRGFVNISVSRDIAVVEGARVASLEVVFTVVLSLTIALGMLSVGVLLIVAMLIIPAAAASTCSRSLKQMALITWLLTAISIVVGMALAYILDFPAGPSIVVLQGTFFIVLSVLKSVRG